MQKEEHLKMLLNIMRDYFQTPGTSWLLVGDNSLRRFIAQEVDRLDDIISHETEITPLSQQEYLALFAKRVNYFRVNVQGCPIKIMLRGVGKSSLKDYTSCFTKQGVSDGQLKATRLSLSF